MFSQYIFSHAQSQVNYHYSFKHGIVSGDNLMTGGILPQISSGKINSFFFSRIYRTSSTIHMKFYDNIETSPPKFLESFYHKMKIAFIFFFTLNSCAFVHLVRQFCFFPPKFSSLHLHIKCKMKINRMNLF